METYSEIFTIYRAFCRKVLPVGQKTICCIIQFTTGAEKSIISEKSAASSVLWSDEPRDRFFGQVPIPTGKIGWLIWIICR